MPVEDADADAADADDADRLRLWTRWKNVRSKGINHGEFIINQIQFSLAAATPSRLRFMRNGSFPVAAVCICLARIFYL